MPIEFPLTPEMIREELKRIISEIREETKWEIKHNLSEIIIEFGDAPEFGPTFGVKREINKLIFGSWLNDLTPIYNRDNILQFILIRECLIFFLSTETLFELDFELTEYILNLSAVAKMRVLYEGKEFETRLTNIRYRFLVIDENLSEDEQYYLSKIQILSINIVSQKISYKLVMETYVHFIEDQDGNLIDKDDLNEFEILDYVYRYLSNKPEEIVAPIRIKEIALGVIRQIIKDGFGTSITEIANLLDVDKASISRELSRITTMYNAKMWVEKNHYKLGLHNYLILIRLKNHSILYSQIKKDLLGVKYIGEIYEGSEGNNFYFYSIMLSPHLVADSLANKLEKRKNEGIIDSFEVKPIKNRIFRMALVEERFNSTIENYKRLLNNEIPLIKITTFTNDVFPEDLPYDFTPNEKNLLRFISIYRSHSLGNPQIYRGFGPQLRDFLNENNIDFNKIDDFLGFMNKLRNLAIEKNLIDFRLWLSLSGLILADILIIRIFCNPDEEKIKNLIDKISIFSWIGFNFTFDGLIIRIVGLNSEHEITKLICHEIEKNEFEYSLYTVVQKTNRYVPYEDLYYFEGNKWSIK